MLITSILVAHALPARAQDDECCSDPGRIAECWWQDAERDGIICQNQGATGECSGSFKCLKPKSDDLGPGGQGVCECGDDMDCGGGQGVCVNIGTEASPVMRCGPSYCNGYKLCSCWGGCTEGEIPGISSITGVAYVTPKERCQDVGAGYPGGCCEGQYPIDDQGGNLGFCSQDVACGPAALPVDAGVEEPECTDNGDCTDYYLDAGPPGYATAHPCIAGACNGVTGECEYNTINLGNCPNGTAVDPANAICCCDNAAHCPRYPCIDDFFLWCNLNPGDIGTYHTCHIEHMATSSLCADEDNPFGDAMQDSVCVTWRCNAAAAMDCVQYPEPENTDCSDTDALPPRVNTECEVWACQTDPFDSQFKCMQSTEIMEKQPCGGTGGVADSCAQQYCDSTGVCDYQKGVGDSCYPDGSIAYDYVEMNCFPFACDTDHVCSPDFASPFFPATNPDPRSLREDCVDQASDYLGDLFVGAPMARSEDMLCALDDFDMATVGSSDNPTTNMRFDIGDMNDHSDYLYYLDGDVGDDFQLYRATIIAQDNGGGGWAWDPVLYTRTSCDVADPNNPLYQYTANDDCDLSNTTFGKTAAPPQNCAQATAGDANAAVVTAGPWPLRDEYCSDADVDCNDWDGNGECDGFKTDSYFKTWVVVDSTGAVEPFPPGGVHDLTVLRQDHNNNSCWDKAAFVAAPRITGEQVWRERWRGNLLDDPAKYENFICSTHDPNPNIQDNNNNCLDDNTNTPLMAGCWFESDVNKVTPTDPVQAFFRVDLPEGVYKIYTDEAGMMWDHNGFDAVPKTPSGGPYAGASFLSLIMATWGGPSADDGSCLGVLDPTNPTVLKCEPGLAPGQVGWPKERAFENDTDGWHGWLEISNSVEVAQAQGYGRGDYELNVLKVPPEFFGFATLFTPDESGGGGGGGICGSGACAGVGTTFSGHWILEGYRLDMMPTGDPLMGHAVDSRPYNPPAANNGWLVNPAWGTADGALFRDEVCMGDLGNPVDPGSGPCTGVLGPFELPFKVPYSGGLYGWYCINAAGRIDLRKDFAEGCIPWDRDADSKKGTGQYDHPNPRFQGSAPDLFVLWGDLVPCWRSRSRWTWVPPWNSYQLWTSCRGSNYSDGMGRIIRQTIPFEGTTAEVITWDGFDAMIYPSQGRDVVENALQFQAVIRIDGRISYFYKVPADYGGPGAANSWDNILSWNAWVVGLHGTRYQFCDDTYPAGCSGDGDCEPNYTCNVGTGSCIRSGGDSHLFCRDSLGADSTDEWMECDDEDVDVGWLAIYSAPDFCAYNIPKNVLQTGIAGP